MNRSDIHSIAGLAARKEEFSSQAPGRFLVRSAAAGGYIFVGTILSAATAAWFYVDQPGLSRLLGSLTFSIGLSLIVFLGAELFTGSNLVLAIGLYEGKVALPRALRLWTLCWCGNLLGILVLSLLFAGSGASRDMLSSYLALTVPAKFSIPWYQMLLRGALCNLCVCLAVTAGLKLKSDCAKLFIIVLAVCAFIQPGLEHSVANMAYFSLYALLVDTAHLGAMAWNLLWVTLGNLLGGAVLLALPLWYMAQPDT